MKKFDILFIVILLILAGGFYFWKNSKLSEKGAQAVVYVDGKEYKRLSLYEDIIFIVELNDHKNVVEIKEGYAHMADADCPDKLCVGQRKISLKDTTIVCLPNKVVIQIEGGEKDTVDGVVK